MSAEMGVVFVDEFGMERGAGGGDDDWSGGCYANNRTSGRQSYKYIAQNLTIIRDQIH